MLIAALLLLAFVVWQFFAVDACLDAGGSFNYLARQCDMAVSHPNPGFWRSLGLPLVGALITAVIGVTLLMRGAPDVSG
jgi:hypothetical protein